MIETAFPIRADRARALVFIKIAHTAIWGFFVACIAGIPVAGAFHRFGAAAVLTGFVLLECLVIGVNHGTCPLTTLAARCTADRSPDFDIYLPRWLAERNKVIFGALFVLDQVVLLWEWMR